MLATLSRWRSRVQIPSGTLAARYANWLSGEIQTFVSAGSTPACATDRVVLLVAACKAVVKNKRGGRREVQFLHNPMRPVRLSVQDTSLSSWKGGFDSRTGHSWPSGVIGKHATLRTSCLHGVGVRVSPWSLNLTQASQCSAEFHKLSPSGATPEPATYGRVRKLAKRRGREPRVCEFDSHLGH